VKVFERVPVSDLLQVPPYARRGSFTRLATPFEFALRESPDIVIARLATKAQKPSFLLRYFGRALFEVIFTPVKANSWEFYVHRHSRRENVAARGYLHGQADGSSILTGYAEWNRATYTVFMALSLFALLVGIFFTWLIHSWIPVIFFFAWAAVIIAWNISYMRRRARMLINAIRETAETEPRTR